MILRAKLGILLLATMTLHACSAQERKLAYDGWSVLAALPASNSETGVAALDGKVYVVGGYPSDRKTVATVQVYDSATDRWQIIAPLPVPLNHVMAAGQRQGLRRWRSNHRIERAGEGGFRQYDL